MTDCIFCKIVRKEIPAITVYEDENTLAFIDINPRSKGMCIVIPKKHFVNFDDDMDTASKVFDTALIVAKKIKIALGLEAVFIAMLIGQVPHFNVRVYPVYKDQIPLFENKPIKVNQKELAEIAEKIKKAEVNWKRETKRKEEVIVEKKEEPKQEEKVDKEEEFWIKRSFLIG
ncbi:MAG: HIT family protein [Candidatus Aenigmarchaeota archaeon]|nr:HIT family protein [Candidatus Aenigmarchaeota archaeon]